MQYFVGLDNGGTTTKAAVFDAFGRQVTSASVCTAMLVPRPGVTERDMEEMWAANCTVLRAVVEQAGIDPASIAAIAICGHGKGLYLWGNDGRPVRNGIISTDNRAREYPLRWQAEGITEQVFARSCQHVLASQPVSLLAWLRDHEPEAIERTRYIFACKDYVRFRLTDKAFAERTDYSGTNFVNLYTGEYDPSLLALFGLSDCFEKLPPLCNATDICGRLTKHAAMQTGLPEGIPVVGGAFDIDACALAVGVTDETSVCMIAGTWSINEYICRRPVLDGSVLMNSFYCLPGYYLVEECSPTSAGNNEWFINTLLPELVGSLKNDIYQQMNEWVESVPVQVRCPIFLPFLMASNVHPNALGCFIGISNYYSREHLVRSIYEGVAFSHRYHLDKLLAARDVPPERIRLAGGVARSPVWTQMFADVMHLPIETVDTAETGALGCAILGAAATGVYNNVEEAVKAMCHISEPVYPNAERSGLYDRKYALYCQAIEALDPLWDSIYHFDKED